MDGVTGRRTRDAIRAFQRLSSLQVTGRPTEEVLTHLNKEVLGGQAQPQQLAKPQPKPQQPPPQLESVPDLEYGTYYALVIGNNKYRSIEKLRTAVNDATAVAGLLESKYGFNVTKLINATRADILTALSDLRGTLTERDNLLIFYAGHGWLDQDADEGYWLPVDATKGNPVNWVSNASISSALKAMQSKHVLVVADSCYSGKLSRGIRIQAKTPGRLRRVLERRSRSVMASGGLEPVEDGGGKHSVFAKTFMEVLEQNNGIIDATELFSKIKRPVMLNADQTPVYADIRKAGHETGGDFLFVRRQ